MDLQFFKSITEASPVSILLTTIFLIQHIKWVFIIHLLFNKQTLSVFFFFIFLSQVSSIKYIAQALSTFHQINAYEEDGFLILDMCAADDGNAISNYNIQNLRKSGEALDEVRGLNRD